MRLLGTVLMVVCFGITGLMGLVLLLVFPPVGIVLIIIAVVGWSSWAGRVAIEAKTRELQMLKKISRTRPLRYSPRGRSTWRRQPQTSQGSLPSRVRRKNAGRSAIP